ncbi:MAG: hypothetical protein DRM98_03320 [Thermoplasmata archaeon]|nr:MAG: hypothetical protein DRM98_03320 [Thermoplasmata archaeon]RLF51609.1 MAG: hypothetical protein DRN24_04655 [Thermoplasmata archaeon]
MKKILFIIVLFSLLFSTVNSAAVKVVNLQTNKNYETTNSETTNFYAVVVGIEEFAGIEHSGEEYLDESATAFYEKLISFQNWKSENVKFLLNENATKDKIHDAIVNWLDERENEDDIVLIYYADHGWRIPLLQRMKGHAYVFTYNATSTVFDEDKISDKEFDSWIDELDSKHITLILDHCYSGRMLALRQLGRTILAAGGKYLLCPCNWSDELKSSIFTYFLLQGMDGVADLSNDGWITPTELFHYVRWPVFWYSAWYNFPYIFKYDIPFVGPQLPYMYNWHIGSIPLFQYRNATV